VRTLLCALALLWPLSAGAATCREACFRERGARHKQLQGCLQSADRSPPDSRPAARIECRRRLVIPSCEGLLPCPEGAPAAAIEVVSHFFLTSAEGAPLRDAVFRPGETVFLRYFGIVLPDPAASEIALSCEAALRSGKRVLARRAKDLELRARIAAADRELGHKFGTTTSFVLPADLLPGEYTIELRLRDDKSRLSATRGYRFTVVRPKASAAASPGPSSR
jgi:hypothetical protein